MWTASSITPELATLGSDVWRTAEVPEAMARLLIEDASGLDAARLLGVIGEGERDCPLECALLHPLLRAPFERRDTHPPASRFRRRIAAYRALYLAEHRDTALAEFSYRQFLFFSAAGDAAAWPSRPRPIVVLKAGCATDRGIDLTAAPFAAQRHRWADPEDYAPTQAFGETAHGAAVHVIRFESVRDPEQRANLAILNCAAVNPPEPLEIQGWQAMAAPRQVSLWRPGDPTGIVEFARTVFEVGGRLPRPS